MESKAMALEMELDAPDVQDELYGQELALEAEQAMIFEIMADEAQKLADDPEPKDLGYYTWTVRDTRYRDFMYNPVTKEKVVAPQTVVDVVMPYIKAYPINEVLLGMWLNTPHQVIDVQLVGIGTIDMCQVNPKNLFRYGIVQNATSLIVVHSHPSCNPEFSMEDRRIARQLREAGQIIGINVLDFLVINQDGSRSSAAEQSIL